eukprot:TRINITY_DN9124_c0_g3_i2.p1 TRINITY_DN9124_c0_g3~~TRINITY_DN9124_c0_g3_i2.p1  ORF type:complete len:126 (-),score=15.78 TRINITY_DN9124_c0_g3_i2:14-391(-)
MLGGMLAGHDESAGELVERDGKLDDLTNCSMSSDTAMKKHHGSVAEYRSSEGKTIELPYRGPIKATILDVNHATSCMQCMSIIALGNPLVCSSWAGFAALVRMLVRLEMANPQPSAQSSIQYRNF